MRYQNEILSRVDVSVIVCPRNRAAGLARTLESLRRASAGWAMKWELVVVDKR